MKGQGPPALGGPIYHLARRDEWEAALEAGDGYRISSLDRTLAEEGFIHCSFAHQVQATADRFYRGRSDVVLLEIDPSLVTAEVRVEPAVGDPVGFPHLYGPLDAAAVVSVRPLALMPDGRLATGL